MQVECVGTTVMTLKSHVDRHRTDFISLPETTSHVSHQVPNERTRVGHLLQSITRKDAKVLAAISAIEMNDAGMRKDFEDDVEFLSTTCQVAKKNPTRE